MTTQKPVRKTKVFLTNEQKVEVIRLKGLGHSTKELAATYNVSVGVINNLTKPTKKKRRVMVKVNAVVAEEIMALRASGKTYKEIEAMTGVSHGSICRVIKEKGDPSPTRPHFKGHYVYLPDTTYAYLDGLRYSDDNGDEADPDVVMRALKALATSTPEQEFSDLTKEGRREKSFHPAGMIYTDEGPQIPLVSKKGDDFMDGIKLTLGIAAVLGLFFLALGQAGVL